MFFSTHIKNYEARWNNVTGVAVLATNEVVVEYAFNYTMFWVIFGGAAGISFLIGVTLSIHHCDPSYIGIGFIGSLAGIMLGALAGAFTGAPIEYDLRYKVTISDEVSMNEFFEKYEVIETEGKIYTVRER